jgi:N6-adenosine-specific RNA methylase IME4
MSQDSIRPGRREATFATDPLQYGSMTIDEIAALDVAAFADSDCRLFLWTTQRYIPAASAGTTGATQSLGTAEMGAA